MSQHYIVAIGFWSAFILDIIIVVYAYIISKRIGGRGLLHKTTIYGALSALVFGIHHIMEVFLEEIPQGIAVAETVEGVAAILLCIAVYQLYLLIRGENYE